MRAQGIAGREQYRQQGVAADTGGGTQFGLRLQLPARLARQQLLPFGRGAQLGLLRIERGQGGALFLAQQVELAVELFDLATQADQALGERIGLGLGPGRRGGQRQYQTKPGRAQDRRGKQDHGNSVDLESHAARSVPRDGQQDMTDG
jgi:hypothetical protein